MPKARKLWRPFDSYTMKEAIEDGFILNPLKNIVPVASKMLFDLPSESAAKALPRRNTRTPQKEAGL
jgi:hypothetical protein